MATVTTIAPRTTITGSLTGTTPLTVFGHIQGTIALDATLTVAPGGLVKGSVHVKEAVIQGHFEGDLHAQRIVLEPGARATGTLTAPLIRMDHGAAFRGDVEMDLDATPLTPPAATTARTQSPPPTRQTPATPSQPPSPRPPVAAAPQSAPQAAASAATTTTTVVVDQEEPQQDDDIQAEEDDGQDEIDLSPEMLEKYDEYTVKDLRESLRQHDLPVSGSKSELIERLAIHESTT